MGTPDHAQSRPGPEDISPQDNSPMRSRKHCVQAVCALSPRLGRRVLGSAVSKGVELKDQAASGISVTDANPQLDYYRTAVHRPVIPHGLGCSLPRAGLGVQLRDCFILKIENYSTLSICIYVY